MVIGIYLMIITQPRRPMKFGRLPRSSLLKSTLNRLNRRLCTLTEWTFIDPDAEKMNEGLMRLIDVIGQLQTDTTAIGKGVEAIITELTRKLPPSPVPGLLGEIIKSQADIVARLERIEKCLPTA